MTNTVRGELSCKIGTQEFVLVPTFQRIAKLEASLGRSLIQLATDLGRAQSVTVAEFATIIDVMSRDPKPSYDKIGTLIVKNGIISVLPLLQTFLERVLNGDPDETGNAPAEDASSEG